MSDVSQLDLALNYARFDVSVFPTNKNKKPILDGGFKTATKYKKTIKEWWKSYKSAYVAAPNSEFVVIDVDYKNACDTLKLLTDTTVKRLYDMGIVDESTPRVRTPSGGYHFYFRKNSSVTRKIFTLPNIDLLGNNGYTILPGQGGYIFENYTGNPWEVFKNLKPIDLNKFERLVGEMSEITKTASDLKRRFIEKKRAEAYKKSPSNQPPEGLSPAWEVDYKNGGLKAADNDSMYESSSRSKLISIKFDEDGYALVDKLNTDTVNALFHNPKVQKRLAKMMGIPTPKAKDTDSFRSVFPSHDDKNPSMGIRWSKDGTHYIVRDFSNHFGDRYEQTDYNLVRLYATIKHNAMVGRLKPAEFVTWFTRMMIESGVIRVQMKEYAADIDNLKPSERHIAERFLLLDACKSLYDGYDGTTTFADRFASAWCETSPSTVNRVKRKLIDNHFVVERGHYDCSGRGEADSFYKTALLSVKTELTKYKSPFKVRKEKKQMNDNGEMVTSVELPVSIESYDKLVNFCTDFDIDYVPRRQNMFFEAVCYRGVHALNLDIGNMSFLMGDLAIESVEAFGDSGNVLLVTGESPSLRNLAFRYFNDADADKEVCIDEPMMGFVLSSDYDGSHNLDFLSTKLNEYVGGRISFDEIKTRYATSEEMFDYFLDGKDPE